MTPERIAELRQLASTQEGDELVEAMDAIEELTEELKLLSIEHTTLGLKLSEAREIARRIRPSNVNWDDRARLIDVFLANDTVAHPDCAGHFCKWGLHHADDDEAKLCNRKNSTESCHI